MKAYYDFLRTLRESDRARSFLLKDFSQDEINECLELGFIRQVYEVNGEPIYGICQAGIDYCEWTEKSGC